MQPADRRRIMVVLSVVILSAALTTIANAQCANLGQFNTGSLEKRSWQDSHPFPGVSFLHASDDVDPIVGFWKVAFTAAGNPGIPDGVPIDNAFVQWHSDGTEIMNSSRPPITSSFCLGVWKKVGKGQYELNHFAISYNPDNSLQGVANIRESVTLSKDGQTYAGTFTIDQYDQVGNVLAHVQGQISGTRISVSSNISTL